MPSIQVSLRTLILASIFMGMVGFVVSTQIKNWAIQERVSYLQADIENRGRYEMEMSRELERLKQHLKNAEDELEKVKEKAAVPTVKP